MIYIRNAVQVVTVSGASSAPKRGKEMEQLNIIDSGGVVVEDGVIVFMYLQYHYAVNLIDTVIKKGTPVIRGGRRVDL